MTIAEWPKEFEDLVVSHLIGVDRSQPLAPDAPMAAAGLDSTGMVALMMDLEANFDFAFPEEEVTSQTFYSAGSLWKVVARYVTTGPA